MMGSSGIIKRAQTIFMVFFRKLDSMQCKLKTFEILNTAELLQYKQNRSISHQRRWCVREKNIRPYTSMFRCYYRKFLSFFREKEKAANDCKGEGERCVIVFTRLQNSAQTFANHIEIEMKSALDAS